jgi:hypothetical protein
VASIVGVVLGFRYGYGGRSTGTPDRVRLGWCAGPCTPRSVEEAAQRAARLERGAEDAIAGFRLEEGIPRVIDLTGNASHLPGGG